MHVRAGGLTLHIYNLFDLYSALGLGTNLEEWLTGSETQELGTR